MGIVYLYTNKANGKVYVGQTWNTVVERRRTGYGSCSYFSRALRKYGRDWFERQVIGEADTQEQLDNLEKVWIVLLQATNREFGYNLRSGGSRGRHSLESRRKMAGRPVTQETRHKISIGRIGNQWALGAIRSPKTRQKMGEAKLGNRIWLGRKHSAESRLKMRDIAIAREARKKEFRRIACPKQTGSCKSKQH